MKSNDTLAVRFRELFGTFKLDVAAEFPARGVTAIYGASGSGKTTLLRCIAGLHRPEGGFCALDSEVWQEGRGFVPPHLRRIGYVFQEASLFPHLNVRKNLLFGTSKSDQTAARRLEEVLQILDLQHLTARAPHNLSGGERQRVAIGRALMSDPKLLLMDEPLSALDDAAKQEILPFIERICQTSAIPVLYVSHNMAEIERIAATLVLMQRGKIIAHGPLAQVQANPDLPLFDSAAAAISFDADLSGYDAAYGLAQFTVAGGSFVVPAHQPPAVPQQRLKVLARDVSLSLQEPEGSSILNVLPAKIDAAKPCGLHHITASLRLGKTGEGAVLLARITRRSWDVLALQPGMQVYAQVKSVAFERG